MKNSRCSMYRYALVLSIALGALSFSMSSSVYAGDVHFSLGLEIPTPGYVVAPPVVAYPAPVVIERRPPAVIYEEEPVVVERRSTVRYYRPSHRYEDTYTEERGRSYYRHSDSRWEDEYR